MKNFSVKTAAGVITALYFSLSIANAISIKDVAEFNDLPEVIRTRPSQSLDDRKKREFIKAKPDLVLDGAILKINPSKIGPLQSLTVNRLELKNGSKILLNGANLELVTGEIASDSRSGIVSFLEESRPPAIQGSNGEPGLNAGTLIIEGKINANDTLKISLNGQNGQEGGVGFPGPKGAKGRNGDNGADHLFDCARGGGDGGVGARGGNGGEGGNGGDGGDGGRLILRGDIVSQRMRILFEGKPGIGGKEGSGGSRGAGGDGGDGGRATFYCGGGRHGAPGPMGDPGPDGKAGKPGRAGFVTAD